MKRFVIAIGLGLTLLAAIPTNAQQQERFVVVGQDTAGNNVVLDRQSVRDNRFTLVGTYGDGMATTDYQVNCQHKLVLLLGGSLYDRNQRLIANNNEPAEYPSRITADTPIGRASAIVCGTK